MIQFSLVALNQALNHWDLAKRRLKSMSNEHPKTLPSEAEARWVIIQMQPISQICDGLGLMDAGQRLREFFVELDNKQFTNYPAIEQQLNSINTAYERELRERHFIFIPVPNEKFINKDALFGSAVCERFPSARADIKSAGNCLAVDESSAAIFHLMRVVEYGLRALARKLKVNCGKAPLEYATWETVIQNMEQAIFKFRQIPRGKNKSETLEFYHGLMGEFNGFKDVWRNNIMHTRKNYDADEALAAFDRVCDFMQRLATRVKE